MNDGQRADVRSERVSADQVMADPGSGMVIQAAPKAVGGNILMHAADTIVQLRKGKGDQRSAAAIRPR